MLGLAVSTPCACLAVPCDLSELGPGL
jgi:hypothetical protein